MLLLTLIIALCVALISAAPSSITSHIIGGNTTFPFEYPSICSLQSRSGAYFRHTCGSTILTNQWILTAAHCVYLDTVENYAVHCGKWDLSTDEAGQQIKLIDQIELHENFSFDVMNVWDVAVLHLSTPLIWSSVVSPVRLTNIFFNQNLNARMIGWGIYKQDPNQLPNYLQVADAPIVLYDDCSNALGPNSGLGRENICTGPLEGGIGGCSGDSGGPLYQFVDDTWIQIGIASWTTRPCGSPNGPTVWVGIYHFLDWIRNNCDGCIEV